MKPTLLSSNEKTSRRDSFNAPAGRGFPNTDYHFQSNADLRGSPGSSTEEAFSAARGFHKLSGEYLRVETRSLVAELAAFAAIVAVSVWPIVTMIRTVAQLLK